MDEKIVYNKFMIVSKNYNVRKLNKSDIDLIYTLCQSNPDYYLYLNEILTKEMILDDLHCVPKGFSKENKYFVGYFYENQLIAILDYLIGYPNSNKIFIGLFMLNSSFQRKGMGRFIIKEFIQYYSSYSIQLAWLTNNIPAEKFWTNLGFKPIKQTTSQDGKKVILACFN